MTQLSRREVVPQFLHTSPPLGGRLGAHRTSWRILYPRHASCVLRSCIPRCLGVAGSASSPKAAQPLGCRPTPGLRVSLGWFTCMARAASWPGLWTLGFLLLCGARVGVWVYRQPRQSWLGLGCVCLCTGFGLAPPIVAGVPGARVFAPVLLASRQPLLGCWGVCVSACAPPLPCHSLLGSLVHLFENGFWFYPANRGWGVWCWLGFWLQPANPGWPAGVCVFVCGLRWYPGSPG